MCCLKGVGGKKAGRINVWKTPYKIFVGVIEQGYSLVRYDAPRRLRLKEILSNSQPQEYAQT